MDHHQVRRQCRRLLRSTGMRTPYDARELCLRWGELRGREIVLEAGNLPVTAGFGAVLSMPTKDVIVYPGDVVASYRSHVIFHEVMHLFLGHLGAGGRGGRSLACGAQADPAEQPPAVPSLYERPEEWEAETGATILSTWARTASASSGEPLGRTESALLRALGGRAG